MNQKNLLFDVVVTIVYVLAANPAITGIEVHEWVSMGLIVIIIAHTVSHWDWCVDTAKGLVRKARQRSVWFMVLDIALLVVFSVVTVSGIMVSRYVLYAFDLVAQGYFVFVGVHAVSAKILLILVVVHVLLHARQIVMAIKRLGGSRANRVERKTSNKHFHVFGTDMQIGSANDSVDAIESSDSQAFVAAKKE